MSTAPLTVYVRGIGLLGPGLTTWADGRAVLRDPGSWVASPTVVAAPQLLPPAERRRAGAIVKLSLAVAEQACAGSGFEPGHLATVFTASSGEPANCHALCEVLASSERLVSPTRFTNSVHNASAGYWHIANQSRAPSTSLCAFDASFGAGLLEAAVQCVSTQRPVLMVAGDVPYLEPLNGVRYLPDSFGVALLLDATAPSQPSSRLRLTTQGRQQTASAPLTVCDHAGLETMRSAIPAARALPLLQALARAVPASVVLDYLDSVALAVQIDSVDAA